MEDRYGKTFSILNFRVLTPSYNMCILYGKQRKKKIIKPLHPNMYIYVIVYYRTTVVRDVYIKHYYFISYQYEGPTTEQKC